MSCGCQLIIKENDDDDELMIDEQRRLTVVCGFGNSNE